MKPIVLRLKSLAASERKITAEIIDCIRNIELQKIHLEMGYPSVMEFLVRECGYSETAALRRIYAARIVNAIPEIREDLQSGSLNLSQISMVAQSVRQKEKQGERVSLDTKKNLLNAVRGKCTSEVQQISSQILDLPVVKGEKLRTQADESVRLEMSLSKTEMEALVKAKEILSHIQPGMTMKELVVLMAERIVKKKAHVRAVKLEAPSQEIGMRAGAFAHGLRGNSEAESAAEISQTRVSAGVRRMVFHRDGCCQAQEPISGRKCGSRHLLEVDHRVPKWAGGGNDLENLELKCRAHNLWKYQREAGIKSRWGSFLHKNAENSPIRHLEP